jgi:hypothetical protein
MLFDQSAFVVKLSQERMIVRYTIPEIIHGKDNETIYLEDTVGYIYVKMRLAKYMLWAVAFLARNIEAYKHLCLVIRKADGELQLIGISQQTRRQLLQFFYHKLSTICFIAHYSHLDGLKISATYIDKMTVMIRCFGAPCMNEIRGVDPKMNWTLLPTVRKLLPGIEKRCYLPLYGAPTESLLWQEDGYIGRDNTEYQAVKVTLFWQQFFDCDVSYSHCTRIANTVSDAHRSLGLIYSKDTRQWRARNDPCHKWRNSVCGRKHETIHQDLVRSTSKKSSWWLSPSYDEKWLALD